LEQNIQTIAILINRAPQIMKAAVDLEENFIKIPLVSRPRRSSSQVVSIRLAKLSTILGASYSWKRHRSSPASLQHRGSSRRSGSTTKRNDWWSRQGKRWRSSVWR